MDIFHLLYRSKATSRSGGNALNDILATSRRRNATNQITGFLIYRDGYYMQLLERPRDKVLECVERVRNDLRNIQLVVLGEFYSNERVAPDWSMAQVKPEQVTASSASLIDLFDLGSAGEVFKDKGALQTMLRLFSKNAEIVAENQTR